MPNREAKRALHPERALTTWSWIAALALLALNDHWGKHAGVLPGWFTGKLSDFAGLYLAPALLATLLRVRTDRALLGCHAAVLVVFAAINLDPACAALCVRAMALLGFDWRIVTDAQDLLALPALLASWHWLRPAMHAAAGTRVRRVAQRALAGTGLLFCMATSDDTGDWDGWSDGGPHLHNTSRDEITVLVRALRDSVQLDCEVIGQDPGGRLPDAAFGVAYAERIAPRGNASLAWQGGQGGRNCAAVLISGSGLQPAIVFWRADDVIAQSVPAEYDSREEWLDGAVVIAFENGRHTGYRSVGGDFVYEVERAPIELGEACATAREAARPTASTDLLSGRLRLLSVGEGPDGCVALQVERAASVVDPPEQDDPGEADAGAPPGFDGDAGVDAVDAPGPEPAPTDPELPLATNAPFEYVCLPPGMFPFREGDVVEVIRNAEGEGSLQLRQDDADGLPRTELLIAQLSETSYLARLDFEVKRRAECAYARNEACAQTTAPAVVEVLAGAESLELRSGEPPQHVSLSDAELEVALPLAQLRPLLDTACAAGPAAPGIDAVVVIVTRWGGT